MKDYKQLLKELPSNTIVCAYGDFDPPTVAHEMLVKTVKRLAEEKRSAHVIFTAPSSTLQEDKKSQYMTLMFPKTNFKQIDETFAKAVKEINQKYKNVIVVAGAGQMAGMKTLKESVSFITLNEKDPDVNGSKMKTLATKALFEEFKKKLPTSIRELDGRRLMNDVRVGLGLDPIKEQLNLVKDELREKYFRGEIFNVGDIVESNGSHYEIVKRGSNHLLLKEESGKLVSKWIQDVKSIDEGVIQPNGTDKVETVQPDKVDPKDQNGNPMPRSKGVKKGFLTFYGYTKDQNEFKVAKMEESALNPADPHGDYKAKRKALQDIQMDAHTGKDPELTAELARRKADLEKEYEPHRAAGSEVPFDPFFMEELTDAEINEMITLVNEEDIDELYEEDELALIYEDTGEEIPVAPEEAQIELMEMLSRGERFKAKIRFRRSQAKRERSTKIALKRYSPTQTINKRARRLAIKLMKQRMLRGRKYQDVSIGDKERIDKTIAKRKASIDRIAAKLIARIRRTEKSRMSHGSFTKGDEPKVF